jgi:hypothetical protein
MKRTLKGGRIVWPGPITSPSILAPITEQQDVFISDDDRPCSSRDTSTPLFAYAFRKTYNSPTFGCRSESS